VTANDEKETWKSGDFTIKRDSGIRESVWGWVHVNGVFGVDERFEQFYMLTYLPSGESILSTEVRERALRLGELLSSPRCMECWKSYLGDRKWGNYGHSRIIRNVMRSFKRCFREAA
jgi:hypothetical protein